MQGLHAGAATATAAAERISAEPVWCVPPPAHPLPSTPPLRQWVFPLRCRLRSAHTTFAPPTTASTTSTISSTFHAASIDAAAAGAAAWYVNPTLAANLKGTIDSSLASVEVIHNLQAMQKVPSAFWIDNKWKIRGAGLNTLEGILADAAAR